jgi:uncharacterized protein DUF1963
VTSRRSFFTELLREVAGVAQEVRSALQPAVESPPGDADVWQPAPPTPARGAIGFVDEDALLELADEAGLGARADDVRRLARVGVRLTAWLGAPGDAGRSRLGGAPDVPPGFAWPVWNGRALAFLGQVDLADVAAVEPATGLPPEGLLLFFFDLDERPSGLAPAHRGSCRVVHVAGPAEALEPDESRPPALRPLPVEASRELQLPGAWAFPAERLDLSAEEMDAWDALRERLAAAQGVELEEGNPDRFALHRLLGYQDEVGREVEVDCQLASSGLDADDVEVYYESRDEHEAKALDWRLLFQLSEDEAFGLPAETTFDRLFVCIREADLVAGNLAEAWAVLR